MKHKNTQQSIRSGLVCDYCGATKDKVVFCIGAAKVPDWCMIEGTANMACPACYQRASIEGAAAIDRHVQAVNANS